MIDDLIIFEQFIDISNFKIILDKIFKSYYNIKNYFFLNKQMIFLFSISHINFF